MDNELTFCKMPLDRASTLRKDKFWMEQKLAATESCFYFYWRGKYLYLKERIFVFSKEPAADSTLDCSNSATLNQVISDNAVTFLGTDQDVAYFVCDLSFLTDVEINQWLEKLATQRLKFIDFRSSLTLLNQHQGAILSYAKALIHWQKSASFCGHCGEKNEPMDGGHRLVCQSVSCKKEHFPRTDPVVIMLVEYQPKSGPALCLLAEHHRIPEKVFSTLAGFVDPGESLQEAVAREVFEEAGVKTTDVEFIDSQP